MGRFCLVVLYRRRFWVAWPLLALRVSFSSGLVFAFWFLQRFHAHGGHDVIIRI